MSEEKQVPVRAADVGLDESWDTSKGLPDDLNFWITDAFFTTDANYNNGNSLVLKLEGQDDEGNGEEPLLLSCGDDWFAEDGGKSASHPKKGKFGDRSSLGEFVERMKSFPECVEELISRGTKPMQASTYVNLGFHLKREDRSFTDRKTGELKASSRLLPDAFLGVIGGEPAAAPAKPAAKAPAKAAPAKAAAKAPAKAAAEEVAEPAASTVPDSIMNKLKLLAKKAKGDKSAFETEAMNVDGLMDYDELIDGLTDGSLFDRLSA